MSRRRMPKAAGYHWDQREAVVYPSGRKGCRWCKQETSPPKKNWCSDPLCVWEWTRRTDWSLTRKAVFDRDRGVCALCRLDTTALDPERAFAQLYLARLAESLGPGKPSHSEARALEKAERGPGGLVRAPAYWLVVLDRAVAWRAENRVGPSRSPWEADHVVPVVLGGDWFSLSNLRLLCCPCHRRITSELNAALRGARKSADRGRTPKRRGPVKRDPGRLAG